MEGSRREGCVEVEVERRLKRRCLYTCTRIGGLLVVRGLRHGGPYLRFDQDKIDEEDNEVMLDILVGKLLAVLALRESHAFAERTIVGAAVRGVENGHWVGARDTDRHHCSTPYEFTGVLRFTDDAMTPMMTSRRCSL